MINDFLRELSAAADKSGIGEENKNLLIQKYKRRYDLALEAGFSEQEALQKFGSPEQIVEKLCEELNKTDRISETKDKSGAPNENFENGAYSDGGETRHDENCDFADNRAFFADDRLDDFVINVYDSDVIILATDEPGVSVEIDGKVNYESNNDKKEFSFIEAPSGKKSKFFGRYFSTGGEIRVYVNKDLSFNKIELSSSGSGDISIKNLNLKSKSFNLSVVSGDCLGSNVCVFAEQSANISTVSGDVRIAKLIGKSLNISTVSGDVMINDSLVKDAKMSSVSGDIIIRGKVNSYKSSSISGDVVVNDDRACETVDEIVNRSLKDGLKKTAKSLKDLGVNLKTDFDLDDDE